MPNREKVLFVFIFLLFAAMGAFFLFKYSLVEIKISEKIVNMPVQAAPQIPATSSEPTKEPQKEITADDFDQKAAALTRADQAKGVYISGYVAAAQNSTFKNIKNLLAETELNAVVIDVKESEGPYLPSVIKKVVQDLQKDGVWVIARICVFRDSSQRKEHPEWYFKQNSTSTEASTTLWRDAGGGFWLDPASPGVQDYIISFSKKAIDFGFDELQFDYLRFPSDGNIKEIIYPYYDSATQTKYDVMKNFFINTSQSLRNYSYRTVLSADLFGYIASLYQSAEIGQRVSDAAGNFDYLSFMLYPSHFYGGFSASYDASRQLPAVYFPYGTTTAATNTAMLVSNNPYQVVFRSVLVASDYLAKLKSATKIRPWLQDFNLKQDTVKGIIYDAQKVKDQIQAVQDAGLSGWLLWNPSNVYTKDALLTE